MVGGTLGALAAFFVGRLLMKEFVQQLSQKYKVVRALDAAFRDDGFRIIVLLRLSPVLPYNIMNW